MLTTRVAELHPLSRSYGEQFPEIVATIAVIMLGTYINQLQPHETVFVIVPKRGTPPILHSPTAPPSLPCATKCAQQKKRVVETHYIVAYTCLRGSQRKRCSQQSKQLCAHTVTRHQHEPSRLRNDAKNTPPSSGPLLRPGITHVGKTGVISSPPRTRPQMPHRYPTASSEALTASIRYR